MAKLQAKGYYDMSNESLLLFCAKGDFAARKERLLREIMTVDGVSWHDAHLTLNKMDEDNTKVRQWSWRMGRFVSCPSLPSRDAPLITFA